MHVNTVCLIRRIYYIGIIKYNKGGCKIIKFTYNIALKNRLTRHSLIEKVGLDRKGYWGFFKLNDSQLDSIVELGGVNRNIIY